MNDASAEPPDLNRPTGLARSRTHEAVDVVPVRFDSGARHSCPQGGAAQLTTGDARILVQVGSWDDAPAAGNDSSSRHRWYVTLERRRHDQLSLRRGHRHRRATVRDLERGVGPGPSGLSPGEPSVRRPAAAHDRPEPRLRTGAPWSRCSGAIRRLV